jgi:hypothetical protein
MVRLKNHPASHSSPAASSGRRPDPGRPRILDGKQPPPLFSTSCHIKRADFLVLVLVRLSLAVFWFNPLSWVVFRRLKNEQESACDERVLRTGVKPSTYAANLLFFKSAAGARLSHFAALLGLLGLGGSAFNERLASILKQKWTFQEVKMKTKIMLFCAVILAVALIGLARPSTSMGERTEVAGGSLSAFAARAYGEASSQEIPAAEEAPQSQEQSQAEEIKSQEKKQQEQAQAEEEQKQKEKKQKGQKDKAVVWDQNDRTSTSRRSRGDGERSCGQAVIIKEGKEGKVFIITRTAKAEGGGGDPSHLEIKAAMDVIEKGKSSRSARTTASSMSSSSRRPSRRAIAVNLRAVGRPRKDPGRPSSRRICGCRQQKLSRQDSHACDRQGREIMITPSHLGI